MTKTVFRTTAKKPSNQRRVYVTAIHDRAPTCCWIDAAKFQSDGLTPQPLRMPGWKLFVRTYCPNRVFDIAPVAQIVPIRERIVLRIRTPAAGAPSPNHLRLPKRLERFS